MKKDQTLAIIGGGPSALFVLQHSLDRLDEIAQTIGRIHVFEKGGECGPGMPYSREHTSALNLSNISSEELPPLPQTLADWLRGLKPGKLSELGVSDDIREDEIYPRVVLGDYFRDQFDVLCSDLRNKGLPVERHTAEEVLDIVPSEAGYRIKTTAATIEADIVAIATGHAWPADKERGNYSSPWPIQKLLPSPGTYHNFPIGLLGASLSAVDVINVLAHHHGKFSEDGGLLNYIPAAGCEDFRLVMHSADGLLSHLQFEQVSPMRELFRHCSAEEMNALCENDGHLRLSRYFDSVCRPVLIEALADDGLKSEADSLADPAFTFDDFAEMMKEKHLSRDPFALMKREFSEAKSKIDRNRPTRWKEVLDDLMYTLNFHAGMLPAEDHVELKSRILPFVMSVMAALPLESAKILMAVHDAGRLDLIHGKAEVKGGERDGTVSVTVVSDDAKGDSFEYRMFIDCTGQSPVDQEAFPFRSLIQAGLVTPSVARFADESLSEEMDSEKLRIGESGDHLLKLGGMAVTDDYQLIGEKGGRSEGLYDIAVPHAAGLRPYCYGLQACNEAAGILVGALARRNPSSDNEMSSM